MKSYKELQVWQKAIELVVDTYQATDKYPRNEGYGLTAQTRRCVVSIPANIAEGYNRGHRSEYIQFLLISFASGAELETLLLVAKKISYLSQEDFDRLSQKLEEIMKMLNRLISSLKRTRP